MNAVNLHHHDRSQSEGNDMNALGRLCQLHKPSRSPVPEAVG
ncbi:MULTISPECIES: hypothetical protein [Pseudomonas]|uniref:Uncharacterized protein n=1 Tax=Pseudomonas wuhanensis TaxID=2954098 RepID=A0ABY9GKJ5_9PSED|nr:MULTISPECIES: hypothetical protein [unclassified Pseudomonas]WLI10478.1 hypothetical protein PSH65_19670 [Pseudomonas sp. FP603]WLI16291.1 hypothetical protein PSH88_18295 [Pseudomonas sp. FP607]